MVNNYSGRHVTAFPPSLHMSIEMVIRVRLIIDTEPRLSRWGPWNEVRVGSKERHEQPCEFCGSSDRSDRHLV
jgi:hypothetical protein